MPSSPSAGVLAPVAMESASAADDEAAQLTRVCELWEAATARAEEQHGLESEKLMLPLIKAAEVMPSPTFTSHIHVRWRCDGTDTIGRATDPLHSCSVQFCSVHVCACVKESACTPCMMLCQYALGTSLVQGPHFLAVTAASLPTTSQRRVLVHHFCHLRTESHSFICNRRPRAQHCDIELTFLPCQHASMSERQNIHAINCHALHQSKRRHDDSAGTCLSPRACLLG